MQLNRAVPLLLALLTPAFAYGAKKTEPKAEPKPEAPVYDWKKGPQKIDLGKELDLDLPAEYGFLGMPEADKLLKSAGQFHNEDVLGLIAGPGDWLIVVSYEAEGYIKDDEKIDADALLKALREGTEAGNKERVAQGFPELHIENWSELPRYERVQHQLVWALIAADVNGKSVNYNTRVLGRKGYVSLNLVTDPTTLATDRKHATTMLAATHFRTGARYEDFNKKTDKVAEYGLMGLILGGAGLGAAKLLKIGLLAKFGKFILAGLLAIGAFFKKLFGKKKEEPEIAKAGGPKPLV